MGKPIQEAEPSLEGPFRVLVHAASVFLPASCLVPFAGTPYITWPLAQTFTIALRAIFQSLRYLLLVGNACHNFKLPPCATPGPRACHEGQ